MVDVKNWQPPEGYVPVASSIDGVRLFAPAPAREELLPEVFHCDRCGNQSRFAPGRNALECEHCASRQAITEVAVSHAREARAEFRVGTLEEVARGWGASKKEIVCQTCAAAVVVEPGTIVNECSFCDSHHVVAQGAAQQGMRPVSLVPFTVDHDAARALVGNWLRRGRFRPRTLPRAMESLRLHGVYLPYWIFDARVNVRWAAEIGKRKKQGDKTVTVWEPRSGDCFVRRSGDLVSGAEGVDRTLLEAILPFNLTHLVDYHPRFLAGWQARASQLPLEKGWAQIREQWRDVGSREARTHLPSGPVRNFTADVTYQDEAWRYVLLPAHLGAYTFGEESFPILINGQSAELAGRRPIDNKAFTKFAVLASLPGAALMLVGKLLVEVYAKKTPLMGVGMLLLFGALVYVAHLWTRLKSNVGEG